MWTWKDHIGTQFSDTTVTYFHFNLNDPSIASDYIYFDGERGGGGGGGSQDPL